MTPQRLGLYGGSFDPPHRCHVQLAACAVEQLQLDRLIVTVAPRPRLRSEPAAPARVRFEWMRRSFAQMERIEVSDVEFDTEGPSTTVDTLHALSERHPGTWALVIGADQAVQLTQWHDWKQLVGMALVAVATRPSDVEDAALAVALAELQKAGATTEIIRLGDCDASGSQVRAAIAAGDRSTALQLLPGPVAQSVLSSGIYGPAIG